MEISQYPSLQSTTLLNEKEQFIAILLQNNDWSFTSSSVGRATANEPENSS